MQKDFLTDWNNNFKQYWKHVKASFNNEITSYNLHASITLNDKTTNLMCVASNKKLYTIFNIPCMSQITTAIVAFFIFVN